MYEPELELEIQHAFARLSTVLAARAPHLSERVSSWMDALALGRSRADYFTAKGSFPMLLLPHWLEVAVTDDPDRSFSADVTYSTVNGYLFVRMVDDVMDRERPPESELLPALAFFHVEFHRPYQRHFSDDHPFWHAFEAEWIRAAEAASRDAGLTRVTRDDFEKVSSRKVCAAKIPLAAVCHRYHRPELFASWSALVDAFGLWHQLLNDIQGWARDLEHGRATYFLTEAHARRADDESVSEWVLRAGLSWGQAELQRVMRQVLTAARGLGSTPLVSYLETRSADLEAEWNQLVPSAAALSALGATLRGTRST